MKAFLALAIATITAIASPPQTITHTASEVGASGTLSVPQFNTDSGHLIKVEITGSVRLNVLTFAAPATSPYVPFTTTVVEDYEISLGDAISESYAVEYDQFFPYNGNIAFVFAKFHDITFTGSDVLHGSSMAPFKGDGVAEIPYSMSVTVEDNPLLANESTFYLSGCSAEVTVTYTYN